LPSITGDSTHCYFRNGEEHGDPAGNPESKEKITCLSEQVPKS
jgi:hypothetical protein